MIIENDLHLQIQPDKLGHMTVGVAVLGAEHRSDGKHTLKVAGNGHLLVELGRLGKIGLRFKVSDLEIHIFYNFQKK